MIRRNKMNEKKSTFVSAKQNSVKKQNNSVTREVPLEASSLILCIALNISARCLWKFKVLFTDFLSCSFIVSMNGKKEYHTKDNNKKRSKKPFLLDTLTGLIFARTYFHMIENLGFRRDLCFPTEFFDIPHR